jgi:hypothetical protein
MKFRLFILLASLCCLSCNLNKPETVKVGGRYAIDIPASMSETKDLNNDASLQYQNGMQELYIIVQEEPKKTYDDIIAADPEIYTPGLKGYAELLLNDSKSKIKTNDQPVLIPQKIGNLNAYITEFRGEINGLKIYWKLAYVEGKSRYYQIMAWTLEEKTEDHRETITAMINSFKETDKSRTP